MYVVAILPMKDVERDRIERSAHAEFMAGLRSRGKVWAMGRFSDDLGGMAILEVASVEEGRSLMAADPFVTSGARSLEVYPWEPVLPIGPIESPGR